MTGALVAALGGGAWWWVASSNRPAPSLTRIDRPALAKPATNSAKPSARSPETRRTATSARPVAPASMPVDRTRKIAAPRPSAAVGG